MLGQSFYEFTGLRNRLLKHFRDHWLFQGGTFEGQGGSAASPCASLEHPGRSKRGPSSYF